MTILSLPEECSASAKEFFLNGGEVTVPRPEECLNPGCRLQAPLRGNGSYLRQVLYWGIFFLIQIFRFRCRRCGKTVSRPYSWLVPYRRFSAEVVAAGIEMYTDAEVSYRYVSTELCDMDFPEPSMDIRGTDTFKRLVHEAADQGNESTTIGDERGKQARESARAKMSEEGQRTDGNERSRKRDRRIAWPKKGSVRRKLRKPGEHRPVHTTVFYWVNFLCSKAEELLMQTQKELVREWKRRGPVLRMPAACTVENANRKKAFTNEKATKLDALSLESVSERLLLGKDKKVWQELRAYFLAKAELCKDILTSTEVVLQSTHSFELDLF